jgi:hypothetical protein
LDIHNMNKIQEPKIRFISKKNHFEIFKWICPYTHNIFALPHMEVFFYKVGNFEKNHVCAFEKDSNSS